MAKKKVAKKVKKKTAKPSTRKVKVWHICRFAELFELPEDARYCRKSPLVYTREFVGSGTDDVSIEYKQQINVIKAHPNRHVLRSVFDDLKEIAANKSRAYRGYLLGQGYKPADDRLISMWVGLDLAATKKALRQLAEIGLVERMELPAFDPDTNEPPTKDEATDEAKPGKKPGKKKTKTKCSQQAHLSHNLRPELV